MVISEVHNTKTKICIILIILIISSILFATEVRAVDEMVIAGKKFLQKGEDPTNKISEENLNNASSAIFKILMVIAIGVAVVVAAILGFNFIIGSVEGKAKIMESLMPYIAGCVVAFGAFGIWSTVVKTGDYIEDKTAVLKTEDIGPGREEAYSEDLVKILRTLYTEGLLEGYYRKDGLVIIMSKEDVLKGLEKITSEMPDAGSEFDFKAVAESIIELIDVMDKEEYRFVESDELILANREETLKMFESRLSEWQSKLVSELQIAAEGVHGIKNEERVITITLEIFGNALLITPGGSKIIDRNMECYSEAYQILRKDDEKILDHEFTGKTITVPANEPL